MFVSNPETTHVPYTFDTESLVFTSDSLLDYKLAAEAKEQAECDTSKKSGRFGRLGQIGTKLAEMLF